MKAGVSLLFRGALDRLFPKHNIYTDFLFQSQKFYS
ncbi:hypothetical protein FHU14_001974 [Mesorhizobium sp. RMAD-H1]|nr:hypothetical protein [Mesorhizobium sp. RMAD-H1]